MIRTGLLLAGFALAQAASFAQESKLLATAEYKVNVVTVVDGLENPWSVAFLPRRGRMLVTKRRHLAFDRQRRAGR